MLMCYALLLPSLRGFTLALSPPQEPVLDRGPCWRLFGMHELKSNTVQHDAIVATTGLGFEDIASLQGNVCASVSSSPFSRCWRMASFGISLSGGTASGFDRPWLSMLVTNFHPLPRNEVSLW